MGFLKVGADWLEYVSSRIFLRNFWEPFEAKFVIIETSLLNHLNVLLQSTQALQLDLLKTEIQDARQERKRIYDKEQGNFYKSLSYSSIKHDYSRFQPCSLTIKSWWNVT